MIILSLIFQMFVSQPALAGSPQAAPKNKSAIVGSCRNQLKNILNEGRSAVLSKYPSGSPCRTGAMNGAKAGKEAGCEPGLGMKTLLAPYYYRARTVCETTCAKEGRPNCKYWVYDSQWS